MTASGRQPLGSPHRGRPRLIRHSRVRRTGFDDDPVTDSLRALNLRFVTSESGITGIGSWNSLAHNTTHRLSVARSLASRDSVSAAVRTPSCSVSHGR